MMINLNLNKVDEAKMKEVMRKDRRPFTQLEVKQWFLDQLNRSYTTKLIQQINKFINNKDKCNLHQENFSEVLKNEMVCETFYQRKGS